MSAPRSRRPGTDHYFTPRPSAASDPQLVRLELRSGEPLNLETDSGVFATQGVDAGTRHLLQEAPPPPVRGELLDLGCGYGPIALTLARRSPGARVWAVDVNERALELVARNAARNGCANVMPALPDAVPPGLAFSAIYSNPPIRVGKSALHELLTSWLSRLEPGGHAYLVVQRHLGSDSLARWLDEQGFDVRRLASKSGYRVLDAAPRSAGTDLDQVGGEGSGLP